MLLNRSQTNLSKVNSLIILFSLFNFFICFGDAIMSYTTPLFIESKLNNSFLLGLIMSLSSVAGFIFDFIAGEKYGRKGYTFFIKYTIISAILFPVIFLLFPNSILFYVIALIIWGIYYETKAFANYRFIEQTEKKEDFTKIWSWVSTVEATAYFSGPLIATYLVNYFINYNFYIAIIAFIISLIIFLFIRLFSHDQENAKKLFSKQTSANIEFKRWKVLFKKLWPLWLFGVTLIITDALFWTIGIVYAESLKEESPLAGLLLSIYVVPAILIGGIMSKITIKSGKKRLMLITAMISGLILSSFILTRNIYEVFIVIMLFSILVSVTYNLLKATYEDYIARTENYENDLIGLEQSAGNAGYIIGPILGGGIASMVGEKAAISTVGILLILVSFICILIIPRKIRLPQVELAKIK